LLEKKIILSLAEAGLVTEAEFCNGPQGPYLSFTTPKNLDMEQRGMCKNIKDTLRVYVLGRYPGVKIHYPADKSSGSFRAQLDIDLRKFSGDYQTMKQQLLSKAIKIINACIDREKSKE
jgi:hypothetical protein